MKKNFDVRKVLNVQHFEKLTGIFKSYRNEDGSEGFPLEKFKQVFGQVLQGELNDDQLTSLFMKIDANSDGTVVFEEFSSFVLASSSQKQDHQGHLEMVIERMEISSYINYMDNYEDNLMAVVALDGHLLIYDLENKVVKNNVHLSKPNITCWVNDVSIPINNILCYITDARTIHIVDLSSAKFTQLCQIVDLPSSPTALTSYIEEEYLFICVGTCLGKVWRFKTKLSKFYLTLKEHGFLKYTFSQIECKKEILFSLDFAYAGRSWVHTLSYLPSIKKLICLQLLSAAPHFASLISNDAEIDTIDLNLRANPVCFDFSSTFNVLGIATRDNNIYLFNSFIWRNSIACLSGHKSEINMFKIHPNAPYCYSLSSDLEFRIWSLYDGQTLHYIQYDQLDINIQVKNAALFVDNNFYMGFRDVRLFNTTQSGVTSESTHDYYCSVKFNDSFRQVVSCSDNVRVFDIESGNEIFKFCDVHLEEVRIFIFDVTGRRLVTASTDGTVKIWNFNNGQLLKICKLPTVFEVRHLYYFSAPVQGVACAGNSGTVYSFIDDPDAEETDDCTITELVGSGELSFSIAHDQSIYFGTFCDKIYIYDSAKCTYRYIKVNFDFPVTTAAVANENHGKTNMYTTHSDGTLALWKLTFEKIESAKYNLKKREVFTNICEGLNQLVLSTNFGSIQIIDKNSLNLIKHVKAHIQSITSVVTYNNLFITSCAQGKVKIWNNEFELIGIFGKHLWDLGEVKCIPSDIVEVKDQSNLDLDNWRSLMTNIKDDGDVLKEYRKNRISKKYWKRWILYVHRRRLIKTVIVSQELIQHKVNPHFRVQVSSVPKIQRVGIRSNRIYQHMTISELETIK